MKQSGLVTNGPLVPPYLLWNRVLSETRAQAYADCLHAVQAHPDNARTASDARRYIRGRNLSQTRLWQHSGQVGFRTLSVDLIRYYFSSLSTLLFRPVSVRLPVLPAAATFEHMEKHPRRSHGSGSTPSKPCASRTSL